MCVKYTPDLITGLAQAAIIDTMMAENMKKKFLENEEDMKNILEVYYVIFTYKNDKTSNKTSKCCFK